LRFCPWHPKLLSEDLLSSMFGCPWCRVNSTCSAPDCRELSHRPYVLLGSRRREEQARCWCPSRPRTRAFFGRRVEIIVLQAALIAGCNDGASGSLAQPNTRLACPRSSSAGLLSKHPHVPSMAGGATSPQGADGSTSSQHAGKSPLRTWLREHVVLRGALSCLRAPPSCGCSDRYALPCGKG